VADRDWKFGPLVGAGALLGIGLGGFVDGILLHQILQWHEMISAWRPPLTLLDKSVNMFWDGIFHAFTWTVTAVGLGFLWRATGRADVPHSGKAFLGSLILGWGIFNVVEGVIDHHILNVHNVREISAYQTAWNLGFLAISVGLLFVGWNLIQRGRGDFRTSPQPQPRELAAASR
jgi:uncharacterized membrane protein